MERRAARPDRPCRPDRVERLLQASEEMISEFCGSEIDLALPAPRPPVAHPAQRQERSDMTAPGDAALVATGATIVAIAHRVVLTEGTVSHMSSGSSASWRPATGQKRYRGSSGSRAPSRLSRVSTDGSSCPQ